MDALIQDEIYPYDHRLRSLLDSTGVDFVDSETLSKAVLTVLNTTPCLEEKYGIRYVLVGDIGVKPAEYFRRLPKKTRESYRDSLLILSVWHWAFDRDPSTCAIASRQIPEPRKENNLIFVSAAINEGDQIEWCEGVECDIPQLPADIQENFSVYESFDDVLDAVGCLGLWEDANSEEGAIDSIARRVSSIVGSSGVNEFKEPSPYLLGPQFLESARKWSFTSARPDLTSNLIESCARILLNIPKKTLQPFRKSKEPNSQQRMRHDGAVAFRTHLTKKGAGFRLMLWMHKDSTIEFANVGAKDELKII